jgi:hypothetical protein
LPQEVIVLLRFLACLAFVACGGAARTDQAAAATPKAPATPDAGPVAAPPTTERPFAKDTGDAVKMMGDAVDARKEGMAGCVREYRFRRHLAHAKVEVQIGIDQDGNVLGVTSKGRGEDKELFRCVKDVLKDASFPRSKAGVITITKTYEEIVQ